MKKITSIFVTISFLLSIGTTFHSALAKTNAATNAVSSKKVKKSSVAPLRGKSYYSYGKGQRRGSYSYHYAQGIDTRKFTDPTLNGQNAFGPIDSDFFFSTPRPPIGGDTPYMH
ncbi:MAG: hypothetical protein ACKOW3_09420 [Hyphomicrobium sp.]